MAEPKSAGLWANSISGGAGHYNGMQHWSAMCGSCGAVWKYCHAQHWRGSRCGKVRCRWDNGSVCVPPIYASFGPQNITVITSQESHYWNAFLIGFTKTHFLHPPNYGYWDVLYTVGKV